MMRVTVDSCSLNDCTKVDTLATTYLQAQARKGGSRWGEVVGVERAAKSPKKVRMKYVAMSFDIVASQSEEGW